MRIEQTLDRIANALEKLAGINRVEIRDTITVPVTETPKKPRRMKDAAIPAQQAAEVDAVPGANCPAHLAGVEPLPLVHIADIPEAPAIKTGAELRAAAQQYIAAADKVGPDMVGKLVTFIQSVAKIFNAADIGSSGVGFDHLFRDGETFAIGELQARVMHTPGHTPACVTYLIGDDAFVGDTIFMPDYGTARCDFPGGDARTLYRSIHKLLSLGDHVRLHLCHDYQPGGREARWDTTVADERTGNVHVREGVTEDAFVAMRTARDRTLDMPTLILPAVQVNARGGHLPPPEDNGVRYLKIPLNAL
jgi:glyoxylase-like metal-dependent hydrolase (beta-lactamase superfamily II)